MITVLAEKPSVAREIAQVLGASGRKEGYYEGNGYKVTWAIGHLIELAMPQDYGIFGFNAVDLPILPRPFKILPRKGEGKQERKADKGALHQLAIIRKLFASCDSIIEATDAGREGELIFRYIYDYTGCRKPFQRLWVSSLTEKALKAGFANLRDSSDFDNLYLAGRARNRADWLVGINASQALTIAAGSGVYSLGRVQTPTLAMICHRYEAHESFKKEKYWKLRLLHSKSFIEFKSQSLLTWDSREKAEEILKSIQRCSGAEVTAVVTKTVNETPPLLFDLTGLQKEANRKLGFSAVDTLEIAQALYEKQLITYPRTGSKYITKDLWTQIPGIIRQLEFNTGLAAILSKVRMGKLSKHIVNDEKVTDHHGLLITEKIPSSLSIKEMAIYRLVALRLLQAVSEACIRDTTSITLQVHHYEFESHLATVVIPGWRGIGDEFEEKDGTLDSLPELREGDEVKILQAGIEERQTRPPQLYTEALLLADMETAGNTVEDNQLKEAIKGIGLGTPATRAAIIETLLHRGYIEREEKNLLPTDKGKAVFSIVGGMDIASVAMTAAWETTLHKIENGTYSDETFQKDIEAFTRQITSKLLSTMVGGECLPDLLCPKCQANNLIINEKRIKCPDTSCGWELYRKVCGIILSYGEIENLIKKGMTNLLTGMRSRSGKKFNARLLLKNIFEVEFMFDK